MTEQQKEKNIKSCKKFARFFHSKGQYPEGFMKVQCRQGYCLFLVVESTDYNKAGMGEQHFMRRI